MNKEEKEIIKLEKERDILQEKINKISELLEEKEIKLEEIKKKSDKKKWFKEWKSMEGKYFHVEYFHVPEEEKFTNCMYVNIIKVEENSIEEEYLRPRDKYITLTKSDSMHSKSYKKWTEITKKEYEKAIKSVKGLERLR